MEEGTEALRRGCALGSSGNVEVTVRPKFRRPDWSGTAPGRFAADIITKSGGTVTENFGAIVQATDFSPTTLISSRRAATASPRTWWTGLGNRLAEWAPRCKLASLTA